MASDYIMHYEDAEIDTFQESVKTTGKKPLYYPSNGQAQIIVNAVTGVEYPWRTGSLEAGRLFKVVDTLGTYDSSGRKMKSTSLPNSSPNQCYYDSPQQFMSHRRMTVQSALIQQWEAKQERFKE